MFFALQPTSGVISDSNPELINLYQCIAENVDELITELKDLSNTEEEFYRIRSQDFAALDKVRAAARTLYLNRTCFNGLFRVNKAGQFNVPYGREP
jgi:DNA adenine methylase